MIENGVWGVGLLKIVVQGGTGLVAFPGVLWRRVTIWGEAFYVLSRVLTSQEQFWLAITLIILLLSFACVSNS